MQPRTIKSIIIISIVVVLLFLGPFALSGLFQDSGPIGRNNEIVFWNLFDDEDTYIGALQEFEARNPSVRITYTKKRSLEELEEDLINELAEGKGPDVVAIHPSWILKHQGKLSSIPSNFALADPSTFTTNFVPTAGRDLIIGEGQNARILAVPHYMDSLALIYNQDYFLQNFSSATPAEDWEQFTTEVLREVRRSSRNTRIRRTPIALGRVDNISRGMDILHMIMLQYGVDFYNADWSQATVANPVVTSGAKSFPAISAFNFFASFGLSGTDTFTWSQELTDKFQQDKELGAFVRGETGLLFGYSYMIKDIENLANQYIEQGASTIDTSQIRVVQVPQLTTSGAAKKTTLASYFPLAVPEISDKKEMAWDLVSFLASPDVQRFMFEQHQKPTSLISLVREQSADPVYGTFSSQNGFATSVLLPDQEKLQAAYEELFEDFYEGRKDEVDVIQALQDTWQCLLVDINQNALPPIEECD